MIYTIDQPLKALSWRQPYGDLMFADKIETRSWPTKYRGWVLICASQKAYPIDLVIDISGVYQFNRIIDFVDDHKNDTIHLKNIDTSISMLGISGHALGIGRLVDCRKMLPGDEDKCYVEYHPHLWCHIYEDCKRILPFDFKGGQKWTDVKADKKRLIKFLD